MPILKKDYESTFKEGFRLGVRITKARDALMQARDAKRIGDTTMAKFYAEYVDKWTELAKNCGRKFTPLVAHDPEQPAFDFGDLELLLNDHPDGVDVDELNEEAKEKIA